MQNQSSLTVIGVALLVKREFRMPVTYVISEAADLAVVKKKAVLLSFWMNCHTYCLSMIIFSFFWTAFVLSDYPPFKMKKKKKTKKKKKKKKKKLVAQAEYKEEAYHDPLLYFVLFEYEAAISTPFTKYSSFVYLTLYEKTIVSNVGLHIFSAAFYTL